MKGVGLSVTPPDRESDTGRNTLTAVPFFKVLHVPNTGHFSVKSPEGNGNQLQYKVAHWRKSNNIS